jgi:hypothetical protein
MMDKVIGHLEVGTSGKGEVVVNHPDLKPDASGAGHIVFSPEQARDFATLLAMKAIEAEKEVGIVGVLWVDCPKCGAKGDGSLCHDDNGSLLTSGPRGGLAAHAEREALRQRLEMAWASDKGE